MGEREPRAPHEGISKKVKRFTVRKTSQQKCLAGVSQMTIGAFTTVFCVIPAQVSLILGNFLNCFKLHIPHLQSEDNSCQPHRDSVEHQGKA